MSGFTEYRASDASERSGREEVVLTWETSSAMLPLVGRIVTDLLRHQQRLSQLYEERETLDRNRRKLEWPQRSRRYAIQEEITEKETDLRGVLVELDTLGLVLLDSATGHVGFPTMVNNRRALFSWLQGDEKIGFWCYAGDTSRRPIPDAWTKPAEERPRRGRSKKK